MITEEQFLDILGQETLDLPPLLSTLDTLHERGRREARDDWANLLMDTLSEHRRMDDALVVLQRFCAWRDGDPAFPSACRDRSAAILDSNRHTRALVDHAGFDKGLPAGECVRRLRVLLALKEDLLCHDKTWGLGTIRRVDLFYKRVEIDFEEKPHHHLSLAYAGETLELIADRHFLARSRREPDQLRQEAEERPDELVRQMLKDLGPLTTEALQTQLSPRVIPEGEWKTFWAKTRKVLKDDPWLEWPARRNDPLRLRERPLAYDAEWFSVLARERGMSAILERMHQLGMVREPGSLDEAEQRIIAERLQFVHTGAGMKRPDLRVDTLLLARSFQLPASLFDREAKLHLELEPDRLRRTLGGLTQRLLRSWLSDLDDFDAGTARERLIHLAPDLPVSALTEVIDLLLQRDGEEKVREMMRREVSQKTTNMHLLLWLIRHPDRLAAWELGTEADITLLAVTSMEREAAGEDLKAQNQLRERCGDAAWLQQVLPVMTPLQRREFTERLRLSPAWTGLDRNAVLARMVKICPELETVIAGGDREDHEPPAATRYTSQHSYVLRQKQLTQISEKDIPRNSRDIAEARAHGDLRENAEFKAAKEMQGLLMKRKGDLERDLRAVTPTDFKGFPCERVGLGTGVSLVYGDGQQETYYILGEWDRDEERGIISSKSRMAETLDGHSEGERLVVPGEHGTKEVLISAVTPLPPAILAWAAAREEDA